MKYHNNKLFNRDLKLAINLAIKIKHQHDKSKNNPRDYSADGGIVTCLLPQGPTNPNRFLRNSSHIDVD